MERCNCLCPGCLRSNLGREISADWFNSLVAALLGEPRRPDSVSAPAINTAVLWPDQLPDRVKGATFKEYAPITQ